MVLFHEDHATNILFSAGGVTYPIQKLKRSGSIVPSADDREMAGLVLNSLKPQEKETATTMADFAMTWNDLEMWKTVVKKSGSILSTFGADQLLRARKTFSFEGVRVR